MRMDRALRWVAFPSTEVEAVLLVLILLDKGNECMLTAGSFGPSGEPSGRKQAATEPAGPSLPLKCAVSISTPLIVPEGGPSLIMTLYTSCRVSLMSEQEELHERRSLPVMGRVVTPCLPTIKDSACRLECAFMRYSRRRLQQVASRGKELV